MRHHRQKRHGRMDCLVVVALLGVTLALLLPVYAKMRAGGMANVGAIPLTLLAGIFVLATLIGTLHAITVFIKRFVAPQESYESIFYGVVYGIFLLYGVAMLIFTFVVTLVLTGYL